MKKSIGKSHCPVNFALETFGDTWSLLIIRDIVFWGKRTYGEFLNSEEGIATNILASRLTQLEKQGILTKTIHPQDKRKEIYFLTEKGLDLIPVILEMSGWSAHYDPKTSASQTFVKNVSSNREEMFALIKQAVSEGRALFAGENPIVKVK